MVRRDLSFSNAKGAGMYIPKIITIILVERSSSNGYRQCDLGVIAPSLWDKSSPMLYLKFSKLLLPECCR